MIITFYNMRESLRAADQPGLKPDVSVRYLDPQFLGDFAAAAGAQDLAGRGL
jgi:hypothetical protein